MNSSHEFRYLGCWKWLNGIISAHSACGYVPCWGGIRQSDSGTYGEKVRFSWLLGSGRAHAYRAKLSRSWVLFPPGAGLFSSLSILQSLIRSLKKVQHYWFSFTKYRCLGRNKHHMHRFAQKYIFLAILLSWWVGSSNAIMLIVHF